MGQKAKLPFLSWAIKEIETTDTSSKEIRDHGISSMYRFRERMPDAIGLMFDSDNPADTELNDLFMSDCLAPVPAAAYQARRNGDFSLASKTTLTQMSVALRAYERALQIVHYVCAAGHATPGLLYATFEMWMEATFPAAAFFASPHRSYASIVTMNWDNGKWPDEDDAIDLMNLASKVTSETADSILLIADEIIPEALALDMYTLGSFVRVVNSLSKLTVPDVVPITLIERSANARDGRRKAPRIVEKQMSAYVYPYGVGMVQYEAVLALDMGSCDEQIKALFRQRELGQQLGDLLARLG